MNPEWHHGGRGVSAALVQRGEKKVVALRIRVRRHPVEFFATVELSEAQVSNAILALTEVSSEIHTEPAED